MATPDHIPLPPEELLQAYPARYAPAPDLGAWVRAAFIEGEGPLVNPDHEHLTDADVGFLWAAERYEKKRRRILGEARLGEPSGSNAWTKGRVRQQIEDWFGRIPDFLITLDAHWFAEASHPERCAVIEHELYHCTQQVDQYDEPRFYRDGRPMWTVGPHDVEEFIGVVRRYGAEAAGVREFALAASSEPEIARIEIDGLCGSCLKRVA